MLISLLLALPAPAADTLAVEQAQLEGSYAIYAPYQTDSLNIAGKAFNIQEILTQNADNLAKPSATRSVTATTLHRDEALHTGTDSLPTLRTLRFTIETPRYVKASLDTKDLHNFKLYTNGRECPDKQLMLTPGRAELTLLVLTEKTSRDTFRVNLIGDNLAGVRINPTGKRPYTMADMTQGEHYRSVALSPTGKYLAVTQYYLKPDGNAQYTTILSELSTGRELIHRNDFLFLNWLPTHKDVLYYTRPGGTGRELITFTPDDGKEHLLADNLPEGDFHISPKEDYLIFNVPEEGIESDNGLKRLNEPDDRQPDWRTRNALWRYDLKTGLMQRLTFGTASVRLADISHDGHQLLLQYSRFDATRRPFDRTTLLTMDAYTGKTDTLLADTTFIASAKFSPDGKCLLIQASPASFGGIGNEVRSGQIPNGFDYRLYLYHITTRETTPLLPHFNPSVDEYEWADGDGKVYFIATDGADRRLFSLDVEKKHVVRYTLPVSYIQDYSLALQMRNPRVAFFGQTAERAREMFIATLNSAQPATRRIGTIDFDKLYTNVAIGTCHDWDFRSTRGDTIHGFYFLPPDFNSSKQYPLIVYYYGGCTPTSKCLEFQYPLQVLAGQGYVVYVPNPSGAIGYGQEFAARHVNTWGSESGDDIIEGTQNFLHEHPFIDPKHVGCMGASYGGFMTQYLQTRTDLFAAAVSHAGISNITSYWGGGYWGYSYGETAQYGSFPWNNPDLYVKHSPLFNADKIHTPLLLLHGTADTNVPTNESQQLFTALKILGRPVSYIQIDGENHVITDYKKRLAWQEAIFAWFAKYLKGDDAWWRSLNL